MYTLDNLLKKAAIKLDGVHPTIQEKALKLITNAYSKGIKLLVTQGLRTAGYQDDLYAQGRTQAQLNAVGLSDVTAKPGMKRITNARGGYSYHNYGLAFDIVVVKDNGELDWDTTSLYNKVGAYGKALGLEWGGDFKSIKDRPHFQLTFGFSLAQLRAGKHPSGSLIEIPKTSTIVELGSRGGLTKELQANLNTLKIAKLDVDGIAGNKTIEAIKTFQKSYNLAVDGVAGKDTLAKIKEALAAATQKEDTSKEAEKTTEKTPVEKPKKELPKVTSLGDKYSFQVKVQVDTGVYKNADLSERQKTLKKDTVFSVYGYTYASWAVPGGFVQMKDVEPVQVTLTTGGLNKDMESEFRAFLKGEGIDTELNVHAEGNPSAELTVAGLDLVKVKKFLDKKGWYYR